MSSNTKNTYDNLKKLEDNINKHKEKELKKLEEEKLAKECEIEERTLLIDEVKIKSELSKK